MPEIESLRDYEGYGGNIQLIGYSKSGPDCDNERFEHDRGDLKEEKL